MRFALLSLGLAALAACASPPSSPAEDEGWTNLFDGASLDGWHGYARPDAPAAWSVEDGALTFTPGTDDGGDLVAEGTWSDFVLEVEWQIAECGNSGIFYRGEEDAALAPVWRTSLEMQVLDNCHSDGQFPSHRNGSLYDLYTPVEGADRPSGAWNTSRIVADGDRIEHWVNGVQVVTAEQGSDDWNARLAASKFRNAEAFPAYGSRRTGLIGLQDHGDLFRVRAVRIRTL